MRGRPPVPTELKISRGQTRPSRLNPQQPKPAAIAPRMPAWLDEEARKKWRQLVKVLGRMRVLTEADGEALAAISTTWSRMLKAEAEIRKTGGEVVKSPSGYPMQNPWLSIYNHAQEELRKLLAEFGLTPAARTRIRALPPAKPVDEVGKGRFFHSA